MSATTSQFANSQAQRNRLLSPAFERVSWNTNIMDVLQQLDDEKHGGIISNVLWYEKNYLLNGGVSTESMEMQQLLGIRFEAHGSGYRLFSTPPPIWNDLQASKVCNLVCNYKLAEVLCIVNDSGRFSSTLRPTPRAGSLNLTKTLPKNAKTIIDKISHWPDVLNRLRTYLRDIQVSSPNDISGRSLLASVQLLQALSRANSMKNAGKIHHNFLLVAAHIAFIKEYRFNSPIGQSSTINVPDFPDVASSDFTENSKLTGDALAYIRELCSNDSSTKELKFVLHLVLLFSPLCLCLPISIHKKSFGRITLMELSSVLGPNKPELICKIEKSLWKAIFSMVERPWDVATILKAVGDSLPWNDIRSLIGQEGGMAGWFKIESRREPLLVFSSSPVTQPVLTEVMLPLGVHAPGVEAATDVQALRVSRPTVKDKEDEIDWSQDGDDEGDAPNSHAQPSISESEAFGKEGQGLAGQDKEAGGVVTGDDAGDTATYNAQPSIPESEAVRKEAVNTNIDEEVDKGTADLGSNEDGNVDRVEPESTDKDVEVEGAVAEPSTEPRDSDLGGCGEANMDEAEGDSAVYGDTVKDISMDEDHSGTHDMDDEDQDEAKEENHMDVETGAEQNEDRGGAHATDDEDSDEAEEDDHMDVETGAEQNEDRSGAHATDDEDSDEAEEENHLDVETEAAELRRSTRKKKPLEITKTEPSSNKSFSSNKSRKKEKKVLSRTPKQSDKANESLLIEDQCITLEVKNDREVIPGQDITAYDVNGSEHAFQPCMNVLANVHSVKAFADEVKRVYVMGHGGVNVPLHVRRLTGNNDHGSILRGYSKKFFEKTVKPATIQNLLQFYHLVISRDTHALAFDQPGLQTLERTMHSLISVQDQSILADKKEKTGTLHQVLAAGTERGGMVVNTSDLPMSLCGVTPSVFSSELEAWFETQDRPFCKNTPYPTSEMFWGKAGTAGAVSWLHMDSEGRGIKLSVRAGAQWVVIGRPPLENAGNDQTEPDQKFFAGLNLFTAGFARNDATSGPWDYEAVYLPAGSTVVIRPNTPYMLINIENSICHGRYFYTISTLSDTIFGLVHCLMAHRVISDGSHHQARALLLWMLHYFHLVFVVRNEKDTSSANLPQLKNIEGIVDTLSLCHIGILYNALDRRSYPTIGMSDMECMRMDQYDDNPISKEDRQNFVYGRGLSLELIRWLDSRFVLEKKRDEEDSDQEEENEEENTTTIKDFQSGYLLKQCRAIVSYNEQWLEDNAEHSDDEEVDEEIEEGSRQQNDDISSSTIQKQLKWALDVVPWMGGGWVKALEEAAAQSDDELDMFCEDFRFTPVRRQAPDPSYQPWSSQEIYDNGKTGGDKLYFLGDRLFWPVTSKVSKRKLEEHVDELPQAKRHH